MSLAPWHRNTSAHCHRMQYLIIWNVIRENHRFIKWLGLEGTLKIM